MIHIFLMEQRFLRGAYAGFPAGLQVFGRGVAACLKDHGHAGERRNICLGRKIFCRCQGFLIIAFYQSFENGVFGRKVVVNASLADPCRLCDLAYGDRSSAVFYSPEASGVNPE